MIDCSFRVDANADATLAACGKRKKRTVIDDEINGMKEEVQITRTKRYKIPLSLVTDTLGQKVVVMIALSCHQNINVLCSLFVYFCLVLGTI